MRAAPEGSQHNAALGRLNTEYDEMKGSEESGCLSTAEANIAGMIFSNPLDWLLSLSLDNQLIVRRCLISGDVGGFTQLLRKSIHDQFPDARPPALAIGINNSLFVGRQAARV